MFLIDYLLEFTLKFCLLSLEEKIMTVVVSETFFQWVKMKYCSSKPRFIAYWRKVFQNCIITFLMLMKVYLNCE